MRRYAASVTDWLSKYREDHFFRTEVIIVALQILFAISILIAIIITFIFVDKKIANDVMGTIGDVEIISRADAVQIVNDIQTLRYSRLMTVTWSVILATIIFGYLMARVALQPSRHALAAQKQFIGNIAHEIRTPLSVIKTNSEITLLEPTISPEIKDAIESNIEELDRISEIINNLLSVSALIRPEQMEFGTVDLPALTESVVQKYSGLASRNEINITIKKSSGGIVWGNMTALQQIISNLIKNAITYTPRQGSVDITISETPSNAIEFIVHDTGIGIARKDLFRIFEPFYRADPSRSRVQAGSGLGLTIVSELVKIHRGKISVQSTVGNGTKVTVTLPVARGRTANTKTHPEKLNEIAVDYSGKS